MLMLPYPLAVPPQGCWISAVGEAYLPRSSSVSCQNSVESQKLKDTKVKAVQSFFFFKGGREEEGPWPVACAISD